MPRRSRQLRGPVALHVDERSRAQNRLDAYLRDGQRSLKRGDCGAASQDAYFVAREFGRLSAHNISLDSSMRTDLDKAHRSVDDFIVGFNRKCVRPAPGLAGGGRRSRR